MFSNFITFLQMQQKPTSFNVNKGKVKVVNSTEDFWVKYSSDLANDVTCNVNGDRLDVKVTKDDAEIIVNIAQLNGCKVNLASGIMDVYDTCPKSNMHVTSGNLTAHISKANTGTVTAHVDVGVLKNSSDLTVQPPAYQAPMFGMPSFMGNFMSNMGIGNNISLAGDLANFGGDYKADFGVGSGILDLIN